MKNCILAALALTSLSTWAAPPPGQFDYYVLSMSHENSFCQKKPDKAECKAETKHAGMVLHGLWPNKRNDPGHSYQYCGQSKSEKDAWCAPEIDITKEISPATYELLREVMPGVASCLHNHEWQAHGSCSGLSAQDYFFESQELAAKFRQLSFAAWIKKSGGATVSLEELSQALEKDLGAGARKSFLLQCEKRGGKAYFMEVHISVAADRLRKFPAPESLEKSEGRSSCPKQKISITL